MSKHRVTTPWVTTRIRRLIRKRNKLYTKAKKTGRAEIWALFRQLRASNKSENASSYHSNINNMINKLEDSISHSGDSLTVAKEILEQLRQYNQMKIKSLIKKKCPIY